MFYLDCFVSSCLPVRFCAAHQFIGQQKKKKTLSSLIDGFQ
jgi:hypothetical protein